MIRLGVTGSIGAGKSTICKIFADLGAPVFSFDDESKKIVRDDVTVRRAILKEFNVDDGSGGVNRKKLSAAVFEDKQALERLTAIIHPAVIAKSEEWIDCQKLYSPYAVLESAIFFERGLHTGLTDKMVVVTAPLDERVRRVMTRDGRTRDEVMKIMDNQMSEEKKIALSDYVIINEDHPAKSTRDQVMKLHQILIKRL